MEVEKDDFAARMLAAGNTFIIRDVQENTVDKWEEAMLPHLEQVEQDDFAARMLAVGNTFIIRDVQENTVDKWEGATLPHLEQVEQDEFVARMLAVQSTFIIREQENTVRDLERWSFPGERSLYFCKRTAIPDDDKKK
jgi:hypothetical protein